jgi:acyl-coenzyme A thioesterase PaaI-like protein
VVGRGHPAGDFLEAWAWDLLEESDGHLRVSAHLPDHVRNPRGQLFGGFTPTYVDLIALFTVHSRIRRAAATGHRWLATTSMRIDYLAPIVAVMAATTLREVHRLDAPQTESAKQGSPTEGDH